MATYTDIGFCDLHYGGSRGGTLRPYGPRFNQLVEFDPKKLMAMFEEIVEILRQGESHMIPIVWFGVVAGYDWRIQNYTPVQNPDELTRMEQIWYDPDTPVPAS